MFRMLLKDTKAAVNLISLISKIKRRIVGMKRMKNLESRKTMMKKRKKNSAIRLSQLRRLS
jgi:hypothetical protein